MLLLTVQWANFLNYNRMRIEFSDKLYLLLYASRKHSCVQPEQNKPWYRAWFCK